MEPRQKLNIEPKPHPVLLIEDDEGDVEIARRAFLKCDIASQLFVVSDGEEALEFLSRSGRYSDPATTPRPCLILCDLNLPKMSGKELLRSIKGDADLRRIPFVVLTTSNHEADVRECYDSGANTYMTKPINFAEFLHAIAVIGRYWLELAQLPMMGR
jgi:two-component system, response regulator